MLAVWGNFEQLTKGMIVTNLNDQVTWGMYLSNFVFLVGVAAAAVTIVFPAYFLKNKHMKHVVVLGEIVAIAAVIMCLLFVVNHMGRPDRAWHMTPSWLPVPIFHGIYNWPNSMLTWDVIVLNGYLALNVFCAFYYMYMKYLGREVNKLIYLPVVYLACVWALSIHTVTAFLINTMPARPMWHHSILPIKFITTAFAAGPSLIIIAFSIIKKVTKFEIGKEVFDFLSKVVLWCLGIALFLILSELVTEFYANTEHSFSLRYLVTGMYGLWGLVPWFWTAMVLMIGGFVLLLIPKIRKNLMLLPFICGMVFVGIWIDKGMGFVIPGFIPSPIGEFSEYTPSLIEIVNSLGNWAVGFMVFTMLAKCAIAISTGEVRYRDPKSIVTQSVDPPSFKGGGTPPWQSGRWGA